VGLTALASTGPPAEAGISAPSNPAPIFISQSTPGASHQSVDPYPADLTTWGIDGPITDVNVDLNNLTFGIPGDVDILLVSPTGTAVMLFSDSCSWTEPVIRSFWTFDDEAGAAFPASLPAAQACGTGSWRPTDSSIGVGRELPAPAPLPSTAYPYYARTLSAFDGENPNGTWKLYVGDDQQRPGDGADHGVILGGFRLIITTQSRSIVVPASADGAGPATLYPALHTVTGQIGRIEDVFVYLPNLSHTRPDDLDVLLVAPGGQKVMLMSDACGGIPTPDGTTFRFNDDDPAMPDQGICSTGPGGSGVNYAPTNHAPSDSLPAPAPPGPYGTSLGVLDGLGPNGIWRLYVHDDLTAHTGYLDSFFLSFDLAPPIADTTAPSSSIAGHPAAVTKARQARFTFTATESPATFECRLDNRAWTSCTSPRTHTQLAVGRHLFRVRASDAAGNQDATPATWTWRIRR
jgi:subtilisin-like proprotein convertase family protein